MLPLLLKQPFINVVVVVVHQKDDFIVDVVL
jgi:hypothetical protein